MNKTHLDLVMNKKLKIYVAGPMSGLPNLNWEAFDAKEKQLRADGWDVVNPAAMDRDAGIEPDQVGEYDYEEAASRDVEALRSCDAIYLMSGFQFSKGACWERALARHWGLKRYYEIPREDHERNSR
jgi:nucleoside 2-deoxyribosyltransferase